MYNMPTIEAIRQMVKDRPASVPLSELCIKIDVSGSWMDKFLAGKIENPGYNQLLQLVQILTKK
jgi:hypothetical protein